MKFKVQAVDGRLRFDSGDGWFEMMVAEGKALCMAGTYNATIPEEFGLRLRELLQTVMPECQLRVCQVAIPENPWLERIFLAAGFAKDGELRAWGPDFKTLKIYSILDSEVGAVAKEATSDGSTEATAPNGTLAGEHAGPAPGNGQGTVQPDGPHDGLPGDGEPSGRLGEPDKSHGAPVPSAWTRDAATSWGG